MATQWQRHLLVGLLLTLLGTLSFVLLRPFLASFLWASILVFVTWPLYKRVRHRRSPGLSALVMTALLFSSLVLPVLWLLNALQVELATAVYAADGFLREGSRTLPDAITRVPRIGPWLQQWLDELPTDLSTLQQEIIGWIQYFRNEIAKMLLAFGRFSLMLGMTLITAFFLYRDGETLMAQLHQALQVLVGDRAHAYIDAVAGTTKAVLFGLLLAALAQGLMAGLGYWAAGLGAPLLLATITTLVASLPVPFGTPLVWSSIGLWLMAHDQAAAGLGLLVWGTLVVSWVDNLVRPLVISGTARVHFLLVLFGILGGLMSFGLIGLFIGPAVLSTCAAVWRQWLADNAVTPNPE